MIQKSIVALFALCSTVAVQAEVLPQSKHPEILGSLLYNVKDTNRTLRGHELLALNINFESRTVSMEIERTYRCPMHARCFTLPPQRYAIVLPLVSVERDACGGVLYHAQDDNRP